jgi:glycosyltransferase involved in cell wall biosynthesis
MLTLHVLPNYLVPTRPDVYRCDAFNEMAFRFSKAMTEIGHTVYFYGNCKLSPMEMDVLCDHQKTKLRYVDVAASECKKRFDQIQNELGSNAFNLPVYLTHSDSKLILQLKHELHFFYLKTVIQEIGRHQKRHWKEKELIVSFYGNTNVNPVAQHCNLSLVHAFTAGGWISQEATNMIFASEAWRAHATTQYQLKPTNLTSSIVLPPFFYPEDYRNPSVQRLPKTCLFLGRIQRAKGAEVIFRLAKERPDWTFWLAGLAKMIDNPDKKILFDLNDDTQAILKVDLADFPNVKYHGYANGALRKQLLNQATVLLQMSQYVEPFGMNVIEAALAGTPSIVPKFGAFEETVIEGKTGFRVGLGQPIAPFLDQAATLNSKDCFEHGQRYSVDALVEPYEKYLYGIHEKEKPRMEEIQHAKKMRDAAKKKTLRDIAMKKATRNAQKVYVHQKKEQSKISLKHQVQRTDRSKGRFKGRC